MLLAKTSITVKLALALDWRFDQTPNTESRNFNTSNILETIYSITFYLELYIYSKAFIFKATYKGNNKEICHKL